MKSLCQRCKFGNPNRCPLYYLYIIMLDVPHWDCPEFVDPVAVHDDSASEKAIMYAERHVRRKGRKT